MTRQEILAAIVQCTEQLGHVPSHSELIKTTHIGQRQVRKHFGSYARALSECNLERRGAGWKVPLDILFRDWVQVARTLKKVPSLRDYEHLGGYSATPLTTRFGTWTQVPQGLKQYAEEQGGTQEWKDVLEMIVAREQEGAVEPGMYSAKKVPLARPKAMSGRPVYGPLMRRSPLAHGPVNEAGVIFLFGTMAEQLGFVVHLIQTAFPDCEAMRQIEEDRWQRVRIEFEYESRNFLKHMHEASECDLIVCWRHNWPECPLEVLELSSIQQ